MSEKDAEEKQRISTTIERTLHEWLEQQIKIKRFGSKSHGMEVALKVLKKIIESGENLQDYLK